MKLMVLDGNSIVNRAYYGIRPLTTLFAEFDCGYTLPPYSQLTARPRESKNRSVSSGVKRESTSSGKPGCAPW